jgi:hypothetical protein
MTKNAVYFFAQYPKEFAMCAGLAEIIREVKPSLPLHLVCATEPNSSNYQWDALLYPFDSVQWVGTAMEGPSRGRVNARGLALALSRRFPAAWRVREEMRRLQFAPNSVAFVFNGYTLNQSIFLRRVQEDPGVVSVLFTEETDDALLTDFAPDYLQSLYLNLFQHFFGTAYYDVFWMRTLDRRGTSQREHRFRNNPADYTFYGEYAHRRRTLCPGQTFWPYYRKDQSHPTDGHAAIVYGGMYNWERLISVDSFYRRNNELLKLIRTKHKDERLLYLAHPARPEEGDSEVDRLDLDGFEIIRGISSEAIVSQDRSITTAYSVFSTALFTTACLGVRTHFLYSLFDDESIPKQLKDRLDRRWASQVHLDMRLTSEMRWMSGEADYTLDPSLDRVWSASVKMLEIVDVLEPGEGGTLVSVGEVKPETRWLRPPEAWSLPGFIRAVLGIPPTYSVRNRVFRSLGFPTRLRTGGAKTVRGTDKKIRRG